MKKNIFIITCLLLIQLVMAQSPGGVTGTTLWLKADAGTSTIIDGALMTGAQAWSDQSGNSNHASSTRNPGFFVPTALGATFRAGNSVNAINFNPSIDFTGNRVLDGANGLSTRQVFIVAKARSNPNIKMIIGYDDVTFGGAGGGVQAGAYYNNDFFHMARNTSGNNLIYSAQSSNFQDFIPRIFDGQHVSNTSSNLQVNGGGSSTIQIIGTAPVPYQGQYRLGATSDSQLYFGDLIAEVVSYNTNLNALDRQKINTYLAIKYGITQVVNYVSASGNTLYDVATFNNNIAGIGRDNASGLHQRQSQSQNTGVQPIIGNNSTIIATNTSGAGDFATDNNFMLWGSDTGSDKIETAFAFGVTNYRMGKIWKIQETNTVGTVKVALRKSDFNGSNQHLLVSNDATFDGSDTMIAMIEETIGGVVYYTATVDFTNGQFFTFASYVTAPGGVISNLSAWYKADGIISTTQWNDESGNSKHMLAAGNGTLANMPTLDNSLSTINNFNPSLAFLSNTVASRKWTMTASGNNIFPSLTTPGTIFNISSFPENTVYDTPQMYAFEDDDPGINLITDRNTEKDIRVVFQRDNGGTNVAGWDFIVPGVSQTKPLLTAHAWNYTTGGNTFTFNGYDYTPSTNTLLGNMSRQYIFGAETIGGGGESHSGYTSENIVYSTNWSNNSIERKKINSYLAIKYGITLVGTGTLGAGNTNATFGGVNDYLISDGSIVWNGTTNSIYHNNVSGIGRDDASALNQKQSGSVNNGNQVIFGLGTVAATNAANANSFTTDKQFLLWGDNGASGPVAFSDTADPTIFSRLARTWFVDNSNSYAQDTQLLIPVTLTTGGTSPKLVMNTSSAFASGTNTYIPLSTTTTINSVSYYVVNLTAAQVATDFYFSVVTNQKAPGGVASNLRFWLNMSSFASSQWTDLSGNNNHFLSTNVNKQPPIEIAKERANFHASADFRQSSWGGTQDLMHKPAPGPFTANNLDATIFASLSRESDTGYRDVIGFGGGANTATPLTFNVGADSPVWTAEPSGNHTMSLYPWRGPEFVTTTPTNGTLNQVLTTSKTHIPDVTWRYNQANGVDYALDGYQVTAAINPGTISGASGAVIDGQAEINDGRISELIGYERSLTTLEKQKIRSYLALKYGVSQNQFVATNYLNSNGAIVWDATANSGFKSDIAGIGKDDFGALNQVMSKSINNVAEPLLSLTAIPSSASNDTQAGLVSFDNNNQYLIWGNNATRGFTPFTNAIDADINVRLSRIWKAQTFNYNLTGNDDIVFNFPEASVKPFINSGAIVYLVLSTTPDFSSGNYLVAIPITTTLIDGRAYVSLIYDVSSNAFPGITSNGNFYFTVAGKGQGPGGVLGIFWNRADKDLLTSGTTVTKWTDQMYGIESTQVADNTNRPVIGTDATLFNFNPYVNFTSQTQTLGNESVAPAEGFTSHIEQFFIHKDNNYTDVAGQWFGLNYDLRGSAGGGFTYDWNSFERNYYRSRLNVANGATTTTNFVPAPSTSVLNMSHIISNVPSTTFGYRGNGSTVTNTSNANYNYIGQGGFVYGSDQDGTGLVGDDQGVTGQLAEHLIVGEALTPVKRRQVESYLAIKYGTTISDLTSDASYRDASGNATFTTDATYKYDIFGIAKEATAGIDQRISRSINNDAGNATNIITVSTDTNYTNMNLTHTDGLLDGQYLIFASNNGAVAFTGGSAITAADGTVFSATEVLATRWKAQDKGGVGCVNMRFNNAAFTAVSGSTKYYMIVADDAAFTQNVTYKEVIRDGSNNIDVTVNFGDNTNGSATTGNYFTIARKNLSITPANLATVYTGVNTIGTSPNWKPTQPNTYLEINSNEKGVIVTRVADVTVATIASPIEGMMVFDLSDNKFKVYTGTSWRTLGLSEGVSATFCN